MIMIDRSALAAGYVWILKASVVAHIVLIGGGWSESKER